jgi:cytidylate kinase
VIPVLAIDGPAASGKSSVAAQVAQCLDWVHVDSGALYRAVTVVALELGDAAAGAPTIVREAERRGVDLIVAADGAHVVVDGRRVDERIRSAEVTAGVSAVSALPEVREWVNRRLRSLVGQGRAIVMDGRDIGTAVFPDAPLKIFLTAPAPVRAERRLRQRGEPVATDSVEAEAQRIRLRDRADRDRPVAPLQPAADAVQLDTSELTFETVVSRILSLVDQSGLPRAGGGR